MSDSVKNKSIVNAVAYLTNYMTAYDRQREYENYSEKTFIDDVLYGLGMALDVKEHYAAAGYEAFKEKLRKHLSE